MKPQKDDRFLFSGSPPTSNRIVIDKTLLTRIIPGMLLSAKALIIIDEADQEGPMYSYGRAISIAMLICHSCELLLKYKIQIEGKTIKRQHDLYKLFDLLENETKIEIETIFKKETPEHILRDGMRDATSILKHHNNAFTTWRYHLATAKGDLSICIGLLYNATLSVYKSTDIYLPHQLELGDKINSRILFVGHKLPS